MSNLILNRIWKDETITMSRNRLLLVSLADQANDNGICWPGISSLCKRLNCSHPTIIKGIQDLERAGAIDVYERHNQSHYYVIRVGMSQEEYEKATKLAKEATGTAAREAKDKPTSKDGFSKDGFSSAGKDGFSGPVKTGLDEPSNNPQVEPQKETPSGEAAPAEPIPVDSKHPAIKAWRTANKRYPGKRNNDYVAEHLGESPNIEVLTYVCQMWDASGYRPTNIKGKIDWYQEARASPEPLSWEPEFGGGSGDNGPARRWGDEKVTAERSIL